MPHVRQGSRPTRFVLTPEINAAPIATALRRPVAELRARLIVKAIAQAHHHLLTALAVVAGAMLVAIFAAIVYDVSLRFAGLRPPIWTSAASEYALLYLTTLAAPWLLRHRGHVYIATFVSALPPVPRRVIERAVYLIGAVVCLIIAYVSFDLAWRSEGWEIRTFEMPRWLVFVTMPAAFVLLAIEFLRYLLGAPSMYQRPAGSDEGL